MQTDSAVLIWSSRIADQRRSHLEATIYGIISFRIREMDCHQKWADDRSPAQSCKRSFNRFGSQEPYTRLE